MRSHLRIAALVLAAVAAAASARRPPPPSSERRHPQPKDPQHAPRPHARGFPYHSGGYTLDLTAPPPPRGVLQDAATEAAALVKAAAFKGRAPSSTDRVAVLHWGASQRGEDAARAFTCPLGPCIALPASEPQPQLAAAQNGGMGYLLYGARLGAPFLPPLPKARGEVWALYSEESPLNFPALSLPSFVAQLDLAFTVNAASDAHTALASLPGPRALFERLPQPIAVKARRRAPILYWQTHTPVPSRRDTYVIELMRHIAVDAPGKALNNLDLPPEVPRTVPGVPFTLYDEPTLAFAGSWKFTLAFENARCNDYMSEKLWRPLIAGSVPVYRGSPSVRKWLPDPRMVILVDDFESPAALAAYLHYLDGNDTAYNEHLAWKHGPLAQAMRAPPSGNATADAAARAAARAGLPLWQELESGAVLPWLQGGSLPVAVCALCDTLRVTLGQSPADRHPDAADTDLLFARLPRPPSFAAANAFTCWDDLWRGGVGALPYPGGSSSSGGGNRARSPASAPASSLHGSGGPQSPAPGAAPLVLPTGHRFISSWGGVLELLPNGRFRHASESGYGPACPAGPASSAATGTGPWATTDPRPSPWASKILPPLVSPNFTGADAVAAAAGWPGAGRGVGESGCQVADPVTQTCPNGLVYVPRGSRFRPQFA